METSFKPNPTQLKIAFSPDIFSLQQYGGISRYFYETAVRMTRLANTEVAILAHVNINGYLKGARPNCVIGRSIPPIPQPARAILAQVNHFWARRWVSRNPIDIVHETYYSPRKLAQPGTPTVLTVLDMIHEKFPEFSKGASRITAIKRQAILRADHIVCISESTRKDLLDIYPVDFARTSVVKLGFSLQARSDAGQHHLIEPPYILFVGKRGGYKNFETLLRAYALSPQLHKNFKLVCFGDVPLSAAELALATSLGIASDRLKHESGDDDALASVYRYASVFVYPSKYEGFGIPPLEAMSFDCPVICSNTSSLPEVVGDAAATFDPESTNELREALENVLDSSQVSNGLRERGRKRIQLFSWELCAKQTRAVYSDVLNAAG